MISVTKLRGGVCFEYNNEPLRVIEYKHTHKSRGGGTVRVKIRNLNNGNVNTLSFKSTEKVEDIDVHKKPMQYLYHDGDNYLFMDPVTFEQLEISDSIIAESGPYLKEGEDAHVLLWQKNSGDVALGVDLPPKMNFKVTEAAPGEKGDSASNVYKDAVLENGLKVRVPLFISKGDSVRVDTRSGEYVERV